MLNVPRVLAGARTDWFDVYLGASKEDAAALDAVALASASFRDFATTPRANLGPADREAVEKATQRMEARLMEALALLRQAEAFTRLTPWRRAEVERDVMRTE